MSEPKHRVIALFSGGKDSALSLLYCLAQGHEIVALANLHPGHAKDNISGRELNRGRSSVKENGNGSERENEKEAEKENQGEKENGFDNKDSTAQETDPAFQYNYNSHDRTFNSRADIINDESRVEEEDIDSYMYQTVGHALVPLIGRCLDVPLYRASIDHDRPEIEERMSRNDGDDKPLLLCSPIATSSAVAAVEGKVEGDKEKEVDAEEKVDAETLILYRLISRIVHRHPDITAISSGAIYSTYQRVRIEYVATRLGLVSFAFLWRLPGLIRNKFHTRDRDVKFESNTLQKSNAEKPCFSSGARSLLDSVAAVGLEARIAKVASGGLDEGFLWADLRDEGARNRIEGAARRFIGCSGETVAYRHTYDERQEEEEEERLAAILGEGGEYETMVLNGPAKVWRWRVDVSERTNGSVTNVLGEAGSARVRIRGARVEEKAETADMSVKSASTSGSDWREKLVKPLLLEEKYQQVLKSVEKDFTGFENAKVEEGKDGYEIGEDHELGTQEEHERKNKEIVDDSGNALKALQELFVDRKWSISRTGNLLTLSNMMISSSDTNSSSSSSSAATQLHNILSCLSTLPLKINTIRINPLSLTEVVQTTLLLRNMCDFTTVNAVYARHFRYANPPARVTIAAGNLLPAAVHVVVSVTFDMGRGVTRGTRVRIGQLAGIDSHNSDGGPDVGSEVKSSRYRKGNGDVDISMAKVIGMDSPRIALHVQSVSYWAPANIGPYSQALGCDGVGLRGKDNAAKVKEGEYPEKETAVAVANIEIDAATVAAIEEGRADEVSDTTVYISGQIPLVPITMTKVRREINCHQDEVDNSFSDYTAHSSNSQKQSQREKNESLSASKVHLHDFALQTVLALQHFHRICRVMKVVDWPVGLAYISKCERSESRKRATIVSNVWNKVSSTLGKRKRRVGKRGSEVNGETTSGNRSTDVNDNNESSEGTDDSEDSGGDIDPWDAQFGVGAAAAMKAKYLSGYKNDSTLEGRGQEKRNQQTGRKTELQQASSPTPPCFTLEVETLPRDVDVEWTGFGLTSVGIGKRKNSKSSNNFKNRDSDVTNHTRIYYTYTTRTSREHYIFLPLRTASDVNTANAQIADARRDLVAECAERDGREKRNWVPQIDILDTSQTTPRSKARTRRERSNEDRARLSCNAQVTQYVTPKLAMIMRQEEREAAAAATEEGKNDEGVGGSEGDDINNCKEEKASGNYGYSDSINEKSKSSWRRKLHRHHEYEREYECEQILPCWRIWDCTEQEGGRENGGTAGMTDVRELLGLIVVRILAAA